MRYDQVGHSKVLSRSYVFPLYTQPEAWNAQLHAYMHKYAHFTNFPNFLGLSSNE